jgi:hypothetical protein
MARNLSRNTRLFISTLGPSTTTPFSQANCDTTNTWEVKVLDGYTFSQDVATQEIGVSESASECAGFGLARGTLGFNTALNPVSVTISTYVRPYDDAGAANCVELPLWCGALGDATALAASPDTVGNGATYNQTTTPDTITFTTAQSDVNELLLLYLYFMLDSTTYVVEEVSIGTAEVDFSIDGIATINWTGSGTRVGEDPAIHTVLGTFVSGTDYKAVPTTTSTSFLRNKLSTLELIDNEGTAATGDVEVTATGISGQVITTSDDLSSYTGTATLVGGRIYSNTDSEWATIAAHTTTGTTDTITVSAADDISAWDTTGTYDAFKAASHAAISYCIPITGGTLTVENNMSYLTPAELAIVNQPLAGFTGSRLVSGSFTAYLNTGAMGSGGLLDDLLAKITEVTNNYKIIFHMGGASGSTGPRVDFTIDHAQVSVPTTDVQDIISTTVNFVGKCWSGTAQSFEGANEMTIGYVTGN